MHLDVQSEKNVATPSVRVIVFALFAPLSINAAYAISSWSFTGGGTETGAAAFGNARGYTATGSHGKVEVSAWSDTKNNGSIKNAYIESAYLGSYSDGLGVTNRDAAGQGDTNEGTIGAPNTSGKTMDNNSRYDAMLFDFGVGRSATLKSITAVSGAADSDLTVLAYKGVGVPTFTSTNQGYARLLSSGWSVVKSNAGTTGTAHYANAAASSPLTVNDANVSARYWLIGALNILVEALPSGATVNGGDDYIKIAAVTATYDAPEPSSLALAVGALTGAFLLRWRRSEGGMPAALR